MTQANQLRSLRAKLKRRDAALERATKEALELRKVALEALNYAKETERTNNVLRHNNEVLSRPHRNAERNRKAQFALDTLARVKVCTDKIQRALSDFEQSTRRTL